MKSFGYKRLKVSDGTERTFARIPVMYAGMERMFLLGRSKLDLRGVEKTTKLAVVLNEGGNGSKSRGEQAAWYIFNQFPEAQVYGKWSEEWMKDPRFLGPVPFEKLQATVLPFVKYTVIIPIMPGWVTAKYWEMVQYGIIPFMHPTYDMQRHIPCPDFIRLKSPADLLKKVEELESNPTLYKKVRKQLMETIKPEYYSGDDLNSTLMSAFGQMVGRYGKNN